MIGRESAIALQQRATSFEQLSVSGSPSEVLAVARVALTEMHAELARDVAELDGAKGQLRADHGAIGRVIRADAQAFAEAEIAPRQAEVSGDRAAIAKMAKAVRTLNQRNDAASYGATDERLGYLRGQGIRGTAGATLAQASDAGVASSLYNTYLRGQYVTEPQAAILSVSTAGTNPDVGVVLANFRNLRKRTDMTQTTAALLTTTGDVESSYSRFDGFRKSGLPAGTAALLAQASSANTRNLYDRLLARGDSFGWAAATVASAAARANIQPERAGEIFAYFRADNDADTAAVLAAATITSGKPEDQVAAAHAWFSRAGVESADVVAASWALNGSAPGRSTMASIQAFRTLLVERPANDFGAPGRMVFKPTS